MKTAIAGALVLVVAATGCQKREKPADDGFGAGATPAATDTTSMTDTMRTPAVPADSLRDTTQRSRP